MAGTFSTSTGGPGANPPTEQNGEPRPHLFATLPEEVALYPLAPPITHDQSETHAPLPGGGPTPRLAFWLITVTGLSPVTPIVFPGGARRCIPPGPVDDRSMLRAKLAEVAAPAGAPA